MEKKKATLRGKLLAFFGSTFFCYVVLNLWLVCCAPVLHNLELEMDVVQQDNNAPIDDAVVAWASRESAPGRFTSRRELGHTEPGGSFEFREAIQETALRVFPKFGIFRFRGRVLEVRAAGYETLRIPLSEKLPSVAFGDPTARLRVEMRRKE